MEQQRFQVLGTDEGVVPIGSVAERIVRRLAEEMRESAAAEKQRQEDGEAYSGVNEVSG